MTCPTAAPLAHLTTRLPACRPVCAFPQTEYAVKDLNEDPTLPYEDASFDVITNAGGCGLAAG